MKYNISGLTPTITATHAARIVGVSKATMAAYCKLGQIPGAYYSGGWQVPRESLNEEPVVSMPFPPGNPHKQKREGK